MRKELELSLRPAHAADEQALHSIAARELGISGNRISMVKVLRRSIDARKQDVIIHLRLLVVWDEKAYEIPLPSFDFPYVGNRPPVVIAGAGPAGLFAALHLIRSGFRPVIVERGKPVGERKKDIARLAREHHVDPDSNYCFGEGGAGTFSDGKLYTRSKKRGENQLILEMLRFHGAQEEILTDAHPHIGTNVLPRVIRNIRETIIQAGGEIFFEQRITGIEITNGKAKGVTTARGDRFEGKALILATGHSALEIYELLHHNGILLEAKGFAMGVRIEHPQSLIDSIQYHSPVKNPFLPAASYQLVGQLAGRGVYSFCMCPGGYIVPSATRPGEVVVNGMSPSARNSPFANSGMVVEIRPGDYPEWETFGPLAGLMFQKKLEQLAFEHGDKTQRAPAQRMTDFVDRKPSANLPECSYYCGTISSPLHEWLPEGISSRLGEAFIRFGEKMKGFLTQDALILGVESRTSSPVRIPRNPDTLEHPQIQGLYPAGEGSGFAGGIVSSAIDGIRCAEAFVQSCRQQLTKG